MGFKNGGLHPGGNIKCFPGPQDVVKNTFVTSKKGKKMNLVFFTYVLEEFSSHKKMGATHGPDVLFYSQVYFFFYIEECCLFEVETVGRLKNMALPVVEFSRQGYKIGKVFA